MKNINRRPSAFAGAQLAGLFLLAALIPSHTFAAAEKPTIRPAPEELSKADINVLFLMTDQQHHKLMSCAGNPMIKTPNMDRIAREGVRFELATCPTPFCSPTRASIITGLYPHTHGITVNCHKDEHPTLKDGDFPNTETILHKRGYATKHRGKWHIGPKSDFACYQDTPYAGKGYNQFLDKMLPKKLFADNPGQASYCGRPLFIIPEALEGHKCFMNALPNNMHNRVSMIGKTVVPVDLLPEAHMTNQVIKMIEQNADKNWMITTSWHPPHALWAAPEPYYSMLDRNKIKIPDNLDNCPDWNKKAFAKQLGDCLGPIGIREYIGIYYGQVAMIDRYVGKILKKLDDLGLADKTLVIFTSDHGDMQGEHGMVGKSVPVFYEGVLRVPLLMRLPGKIKPGTVVSEPVSLVDLMPTILDYLDLPCPSNVQGKSLRPLVEGRTKNWRKYSFSERRNTDGSDVMIMIRSNRHKYVYRENTKHQLYDLLKDPHENENKFTDPAQRKTIQKLHKQLIKWMKETKDPFLKKIPKTPFD